VRFARMEGLYFDKNKGRYVVERRVPIAVREIIGGSAKRHHKFSKAVDQTTAKLLGGEIIRRWEAEWNAVLPKPQQYDPSWDLTFGASYLGRMIAREGLGLPPLSLMGNEAIGPPEPNKQADTSAVVPFSDAVDLWVKKRHRDGKETTSTDVARLNSRIARLVTYLGYDDMRPITTPELEAYFDGFTESAGTIKDHIIYVKALFNLAQNRGKIPSNPAKGLSYKRDTGGRKQPFTPQERARILAAARECGRPEFKWPNLLSGFSGARIAEIVEADTRDIVVERDDTGAVRVVFHIRKKNRLPNARLKTRDSQRWFVVHSSLLPEFVDYVDQTRRFHGGEGPLFYQFRVYVGRRNKDASTKINAWIDKVAKVADDDKSFHSWRHCIATALEGRKWGAWLTGHSSGTIRQKHYIHPPLHEVAADIESLKDPGAT
jgi:integrase